MGKKAKMLFTDTDANYVERQHTIIQSQPIAPIVRYPAKRYYRRDLGIEFKSSMEANVFRFFLTRRWDRVLYEPECFKFPKGASPLGITGYIPDIKLIDRHREVYVEVKGYVDEPAREKARLMKKYYPYIRMWYILPEGYKKIKDNYAHKIPNWE